MCAFNAKKKYETTTTEGGGGGDIRRMKLAQGLNVVRIVDDNFEDAWVHYFKDAEGNNRRTICHGKGKCPLCAKKISATHRFYFNVIDRKAQKETGKTEVRLLEIGKMIYEQIRELALDEEYGDPTQYNLKINRKGEKKSTKYTVRASSKKYPLKESEISVIESSTEEGGLYDLNVFTARQTKSEILEMLGEANSEEEETGTGEEVAENTNDTETGETDSGGDEEEVGEDTLDIDKELEELEADDEPAPAKKSKAKSKKVVDDEEEW